MHTSVAGRKEKGQVITEYVYKARVQSRKGVSHHTIEAVDEASARRLLKEHGTVVSLKNKGRSKGLKGSLSYSERQVFLSRLSAMLMSGIGAGSALQLMKTTFRGPVSRISGYLHGRLVQGQTLPEALRSLNKRIIPEMTAAMIQAGAKAGATSDALRNAMLFERDMRRIKKDSSKGMWQAIGGFLTAVGFMLGTIFGFLPYILDSQLMVMVGDDTSLDTAVEFSYVVGYGIAATLFIFLFFAFFATLGRQIAPAYIDRVILKIPFYKHIVLAKNNFIAFYAFALLVRSGVSMENALTTMVNTTPKSALQHDFKKSLEAVLKGQPWYEPLKCLEDTDRAALGASQERKQIAQSMSAIATQYQDIYASIMEAFVPVLQLLAAFFLLMAGLVMFGATILPMLQLSSQIL